MVKKTKCERGGGVARKNLSGGYAGEGKEDQMRGEGVFRKKLRGGGVWGMPERVKKTKWGGGLLRNRVGVCREGKENNMREGVSEKIEGGG